MYVDDDTNSGICASDTKTEYLFQILALYVGDVDPSTKTQSMQFSQNYANISGSTLYGGLLDRCAASQFADVRNKHSNYIQNYEYKAKVIENLIYGYFSWKQYLHIISPSLSVHLYWK